MSLLYPRLDKEATLQIWKNHLSKLQKQFKKNGRAFEVDKKGILSFARSHYKELVNLDSGTWNGRYVQTNREQFVHVNVISFNIVALDLAP